MKLSEQQIIELAINAGFIQSDGWIGIKTEGYEGSPNIKDNLILLANALHAKFIESLGEPVAYRQRIEVTQGNETYVQCGYSDFQIMLGDTKLYALPNEVK